MSSPGLPVLDFFHSLGTLVCPSNRLPDLIQPHRWKPEPGDTALGNGFLSWAGVHTQKLSHCVQDESSHRYPSRLMPKAVHNPRNVGITATVSQAVKNSSVLFFTSSRSCRLTLGRSAAFINSFRFWLTSAPIMAAFISLAASLYNLLCFESKRANGHKA